MFPDSLGSATSELFAQPFTMPLLNAVLGHDYETHRHLLGTGILATRVALAAGVAHEDAVAIGQAALFHDVGKLYVDAALLSAARPLDPAEWETMRKHPELGERVLRERGATELARIVRGHHERLDGSGYPDGIKGLMIPWQTRLLAVVDAYDCMRAGRAYAVPVAHADALDRLVSARHLFDVDAVDALVATVGGREAATAIS